MNALFVLEFSSDYCYLLYVRAGVAQSEVLSRAPHTRFLVRVSFEFPTQGNQAFHPSGDGELAPDLTGKTKALTCCESLYGQIRILITSATSHKSRIHGASQKSFSNAVFYLFVPYLVDTMSLGSQPMNKSGLHPSQTTLMTTH